MAIFQRVLWLNPETRKFLCLPDNNKIPRWDTTEVCMT